MHTLFLSFRRSTALSSALFIALITLLSGCASKNPLIDEPGEQTKPVLAAESAASVSAAKPATDVKAASEAKPVATLFSEPDTKTPAVPADQVQMQPVSNMNKQAPTGLKRWMGIFTPYKVNIQQGNFISQDMAAKLRPGLTKEQVKFLLGTPLLTDMFHGNRWDYLFRLQKPNGALTTNRVAIFFKDDRVERIEGSELPNEMDYLSHIAGSAPIQAAQPAQKDATLSNQSPTQP